MAQQDRINGLVGTLGIKAPVRVATTANITLSGEQTIDGVAAVAGDRVLVKDQTTGSENGIYAVATTAWVREPDFDGSRDVVTGTMVHIASGTVNSGTTWAVSTTGTITIGTTSIAFTRDFGNLASDIHLATSKATPVDADELPLADSAASFGLKKLTFANLGAWVWSKLGPLISGGTTKATLVDADSFAITDSEASGVSKKVSLANLRTAVNLFSQQDIGAGSSGGYIVPSWAKVVVVYMCGGGGGGGGGNTSLPGGGGGSGNHMVLIFAGTVAGHTLAYSTGAAGAAGAYGATNGTAGGNGGHTTLTWDNAPAWTWTAGGGEGGQPATNSPTAGYAAGQGGRAGNTAEVNSAPAGVTHGQFNLSSTTGQSGQILKKYGTWAPALTYATPGDVSLAYATQSGEYEIEGDILRASFNVVTSTHTYTTAAGNLQLTGFPVAATATGSLRNVGGGLEWAGINKVNYSQISADVNAGAQLATLYASGMGVAISTVQPPDTTSGTQITLRGQTSYRVASGSGGVGGWGGMQGDIGGGGRGGAPGAGGGTGTDAAAGGYIHIEAFG